MRTAPPLLGRDSQNNLQSAGFEVIDISEIQDKIRLQSGDWLAQLSDTACWNLPMSFEAVFKMLRCPLA